MGGEEGLGKCRAGEKTKSIQCGRIGPPLLTKQPLSSLPPSLPPSPTPSEDRIHAQWLQCTARTGRLASQHPNMYAFSSLPPSLPPSIFSPLPRHPPETLPRFPLNPSYISSIFLPLSPSLPSSLPPSLKANHP
jgi:hypothetical protein